MALALWDLLLVYGIKPEPALYAVAAFVLNRYYFSFIAYDFYQLNDTISISCLWLSISFLKRRQLYWVLPIAMFGILAREILLIWIPVALYILYNEKNEIKEWGWVGMISLLLIIVFIGMRLMIPAKGGIDIFQALTDDWNKIIDPWAIAKQLFVANTPLFLLPILFYKSLHSFIKEYPEILVLLVVTYLTTLFGHDYERLMAPAAPFIYLFTAELIQKIFANDRLKKNPWGATFFLIVIVGNFYHLWGIVILPDRFTTIIMTIITGISMGALFLVTLKRRDLRL